MTAAQFRHTASPVRPAVPPQSRRAEHERRERAATEDAELRALRDRLTEEALTDGAFPGLRILRSEIWWDGAMERTCLTVAWRRARWRLLVLDADTVVPLPFRARAARRQLDRYRAALGRPAVDQAVPGSAGVVTVPLAPSPVLPRLTGDDPEHALVAARLRTLRANATGPVRVEQQGDWISCSRPSCAALVPLPPPGELIDIADAAGPVCGRCG